jgi:hypothetical protein
MTPPQSQPIHTITASSQLASVLDPIPVCKDSVPRLTIYRFAMTGYSLQQAASSRRHDGDAAMGFGVLIQQGKAKSHGSTL